MRFPISLGCSRGLQMSRGSRGFWTFVHAKHLLIRTSLTSQNSVFRTGRICAPIRTSGTLCLVCLSTPYIQLLEVSLLTICRGWPEIPLAGPLSPCDGIRESGTWITYRNGDPNQCKVCDQVEVVKALGANEGFEVLGEPESSCFRTLDIRTVETLSFRNV